MTLIKFHWHGVDTISNLSRTTTYDTNTGIIGKNPKGYALGLPDGSKIAMGTDAYKLLIQPIWGGQNLTFEQVISEYVLETLPVKYLTNINLFPSVLPEVRVEPYWAKTTSGQIFPSIEYNYNIWMTLGITSWKDPLVPDVPTLNPIWIETNDRNLVKIAAYKQLLIDTFILCTQYQFPGYPIVNVKWFENDIEVDVTPTHWLAVPNYNYGFKLVYKPYPNNPLDTNWDRISKSNISVMPLDLRIRKLVGL